VDWSETARTLWLQCHSMKCVFRMIRSGRNTEGSWAGRLGVAGAKQTPSVGDSGNGRQDWEADGTESDVEGWTMRIGDMEIPQLVGDEKYKYMGGHGERGGSENASPAGQRDHDGNAERDAESDVEALAHRSVRSGGR